MLVRNYSDVAVRAHEGSIRKRVVIGPKQGAPTFVMRVMEFPPGVSSPDHHHDWEHEVFVLSGQGLVVTADKETPVGHGDTIFLAPNEQHYLKNAGPDIFRFICLVPLRGEDTP